MKFDPTNPITGNNTWENCQALVNRGCKVVVLGDGGTSGAKHPRPGSHGVKDATDDLQVLQELLAKLPKANIGIVPGLSAEPMVVLDVDPRNGGDETLRRLEEEYGPLPETVSTLTPSDNGCHRFYKVPPECVESLKGKLGLGIDVICHSKYVLVEPSIGENGRQYAFDLEHHPDEHPIAELPEAWLNLLRKEVPVQYQAGEVVYPTKTSAYGRQVLQAESFIIENAPFGEQEETFNSGCLKVFSVAKAGHISYADAHQGLLNAALAMANQPGKLPWTKQEIAYKIGRTFEAAIPRNII
jgi:hypothetical protein